MRPETVDNYVNFDFALTASPESALQALKQLFSEAGFAKPTNAIWGRYEKTTTQSRIRTTAHLEIGEPVELTESLLNIYRGLTGSNPKAHTANYYQLINPPQDDFTFFILSDEFQSPVANWLKCSVIRNASSNSLIHYLAESKQFTQVDNWLWDETTLIERYAEENGFEVIDYD